MLFNTSNISIDLITNENLRKKNITLSVIRLDKIHPIVSGNKLFKLHFYLKEAIKNLKEGIITFGGAYSNHLVATAFACKELNLKSIAFVRGEKPANLSPTLLSCIEYGMELMYISRADYEAKDTTDFLSAMVIKWPNHIIIPEGGYGTMGAAGAALITNFTNNYSHICTPIGTATTYAGLLMGAKDTQQIIGVPVIKGESDLKERILFLTGKSFTLCLFEEFTFGGYAKKTPRLINFMNDFYRNYTIVTDFVYTAKMIFAVLDKIENDYFNAGSNIACLHTGGLQGNRSLPAGNLIF